METVSAVATPRERRLLPALLRWHGRVGVVACVGVLMWALSGVLHPVMSRMQPRAVTFALPSQVLDLRNAPPLAQVLQKFGVTRIDWFRVVALPEGQYYQVALPGQSELAYFRFTDGQRAPDMDRTYAEYLSRHYLGDQQSVIAETRRVSGFDSEYSYINRFLPAYRVAFTRDDAMRVYVDTATSRLGTLVDRPKSWFGAYFQSLHTWSFLDGAPRVRAVLMSLLLLAAFLTAMMGIWIYGFRFASLAKPSGLRRIHRAGAILVSIATLTFTFSGAYHVLQGVQPPMASPGLRAGGFDATEFKVPLTAVSASLPAGVAVRAISPAHIDDRTYYRIETVPPMLANNDGHHAPPLSGAATIAQPPILIDAADGRILKDGEARYARSLALAFSGLSDSAIRATGVISKFESEYGFVFKRLPVSRIEFAAPGRPRYYVDTSFGVLAARIDDSDAREGWSFAYLHKFEWLAGFGTLTRDGIAMAFALGNALVAILGCVLFMRRRQRL